MRKKSSSRRLQLGAAIVEFALVAMIFVALLVGVMEFGRWLFTLNSASEATRWGARLAVVCSEGDPQIREKMQIILPILKDPLENQIEIIYSPDKCKAACAPGDSGCTECETVDVFLKNVTISTFIPFVSGPYSIPSFRVTLPRESMDSANGNNEVCE